MSDAAAPHFVNLDEVPSTSTWLAANAGTLPHGTVVSARAQTAGRGQRGNSWEADPGLNVTMSVLLRPLALQARSQFTLSQAVALACADTLAPLVPAQHSIWVKWPNDIYVDDCKIGGILIENILHGPLVAQSIAGVGVNVNQPLFRSPAPNPVSLLQLTGRTHDTGVLLRCLAARILAYADGCTAPGADTAPLHRAYMRRLWRGQGEHPYRDTATGRTFRASISSVAPTGHLTLRHAVTGALLTYAFKEVAFL